MRKEAKSYLAETSKGSYFSNILEEECELPASELSQRTCTNDIESPCDRPVSPLQNASANVSLCQQLSNTESQCKTPSSCLQPASATQSVCIQPSDTGEGSASAADKAVQSDPKSCSSPRTQPSTKVHGKVHSKPNTHRPIRRFAAPISSLKLLRQKRLPHSELHRQSILCGQLSGSVTFHKVYKSTSAAKIHKHLKHFARRNHTSKSKGPAVIKPSGYRIVSCEKIEQSLSSIAVCVKCLKGRLELEEKSLHYGWNTFIRWACNNVDCRNTTDWTATSKTVSRGRKYEVRE